MFGKNTLIITNKISENENDINSAYQQRFTL